MSSQGEDTEVVEGHAVAVSSEDEQAVEHYYATVAITSHWVTLESLKLWLSKVGLAIRSQRSLSCCVAHHRLTTVRVGVVVFLTEPMSESKLGRIESSLLVSLLHIIEVFFKAPVIVGNY